MNYSKSESVKKHYKTGDKVRAIKTFYPLPTNIIGK